MRIVRSVRLWLKDGTSDKLYEVDLVENDALASDHRFLVNVRYGRRGALLREGSKTPAPITREAADRLFDSIVVSKLNGGYRRVDQPAAGLDAEPRGAPGDAAALGGRGHVLMARLEACLRSPWPAKELDRLVWRIGELRLAAAGPALIALAGRQGPARASYSLVWALARAAGGGAAPTLEAIAAGATETIVRDLARFALVSPLAGDARRPDGGGDLPEPVARAAQARNPDALLGALTDLAGREPVRVGNTLVVLGRMAQGDPALHAALAATLLRLPARPPYLIGLRRLFKHAEMADDAVLFAVTAHRFETAQPMYSARRSGSGRPYVPELRMAVPIAEVHGAPDARVGLSEATLFYFKRRIWRALRKRAEVADPAFAELAAAFLLSLRPQDMARPTTRTSWRREENGRWSREDRVSGPLARNWTASQLLCRNDPAIRLRYGSLTAQEAPARGEAPGTRPEAFPSLWDARPDLALDLAADSACEPVSRFGVRLLKAAPDFLRAAPPAALARLLRATDIAAQGIGFAEARDRLAAGDADPALLAALLAAEAPEARRLAATRIDGFSTLPWSDPDLALGALLCPHEDLAEPVLRWARERRVAGAAGQALAGRLVAWLLERPSAPDEGTEALLRLVRARMAALWSTDRMPLMPEAIEQLMAHPAPAVVAAGVDGLALSGADAGAIPNATWERLLGSPSVDVQSAALGLFGRLDDAALAGHAPLIVAFATAPSPGLRRAARPLVARLAARDPALAERLSRALIDSLFRSGPDETYPVDTVALLREAMPDRIAALDAGMLWRLLQARAAGARLLGSTELPNRPFGIFSVRQIARLGGHPHAAARHWALAAYGADPARFQAEAADAVLLVESDWPEVQDFARDHFDRWPDEAWTPATLAVVTDSVKPEVLAFARRLLRSRLAPADAAAQLTRLLEHPSQAMHLIATELLTADAAASEEAFEKLLPLARIVMLQVHKGRVAKDRMTAFLRGEALRDAGRAARIAPLFTDFSLSGVGRDRAAAILALRDIAEAHPQVATPLVRRPVPERAA
ncbi:hypothetical protein [Methylobacterium nodulans]|uniref:WGR domain-containing protein n=1 Tax=Methylobacterium nodulans (strain LMG 21967 / CNCM I-2342 / ORS 2060) TaxID=460265 RepID=B8IJL4_METNO|nr:hypothetical protein [Methylobacterium nodulans]ACL58062.1 conserved hypothetical protein [Methylobacterium nodulans ORS 2060]